MTFNGTEDMAQRLIEATRVACPHWREGTRLAHSTGVAAEGVFRGAVDAQRWCRSDLFDRSWKNVIVRFSNASGGPDPETDPQVRGMAVKFLLDDGDGGVEEVDLVGMNLPVFVANTPEATEEFGLASKLVDAKSPGWWKKLRGLLTMNPAPEPPPGVDRWVLPGVLDWAAGYPPSHVALGQLGLMMQLPPPASFARQMYSCVHAFEVEGDDGSRHLGRFTFEPSEGVRQVTSLEGLGPDYLSRELEERLNHDEVSFTVRMQLADPWDDPTDCTKVWPSNRRQVLMGTITLRTLYEDADGQVTGEKLSFNPGRLPRYMASAGDPIHEARIAVYDEAQRQRRVDRAPIPE